MEKVILLTAYHDLIVIIQCAYSANILVYNFNIQFAYFDSYFDEVIFQCEIRNFSSRFPAIANDSSICLVLQEHRTEHHYYE